MLTAPANSPSNIISNSQQLLGYTIMFIACSLKVYGCEGALAFPLRATTSLGLMMRALMGMMLFLAGFTFFHLTKKDIVHAWETCKSILLKTKAA
jgi:hypothetical protein